MIFYYCKRHLYLLIKIFSLFEEGKIKFNYEHEIPVDNLGVYS